MNVNEDRRNFRSKPPPPPPPRRTESPTEGGQEQDTEGCMQQSAGASRKPPPPPPPRTCPLVRVDENESRDDTANPVVEKGDSTEEPASTEGADDEAAASAAAMDRLSEVAARRKKRMEARRGISIRISAAIRSQDPLVLLFQLMLEIADVVLNKLNSTLAESPTWKQWTKGCYTPGSIFEANDRALFWMDLFFQIVCGWPSACVAFGPIDCNSDTPLGRFLKEQHKEDPDPGASFFGTLSIVQVEGMEALPSGPITEQFLSMKALLERSMVSATTKGPLLAMRFSSAVAKALSKIERIELGLGGTPKRPTEFQMQYLQRIITASLEAISQFEAEFVATFSE